MLPGASPGVSVLFASLPFKRVAGTLLSTQSRQFSTGRRHEGAWPAGQLREARAPVHVPLWQDGLLLDPLRTNSGAYLIAGASLSQWQSAWMLARAAQKGQRLHCLLKFLLAEGSTARRIVLGTDPVQPLDSYASKVIRERQQTPECWLSIVSGN